MADCTCLNDLQNLATRKCDVNFKDLYGIIVVPTYDNAGARNKVASGDTLNEAFFTNLINNTDESKRWFPLWGIDVVENARNESDTYETEGGDTLFVQEGVRNFAIKKYKSSNKLGGWLKKTRCNEFGLYLVDKDRKIIGMLSGGDLYPIKMNAETVDVLFNWASKSTPQDNMFKVQWDRLEKDENLRAITETEAGVDITTILPLLDVIVAVTPIDNVSFTMKLTLANDTFKTEVPVTGWVTADVEVKGVAVTSVTETATPGTYTVVTPNYSGETNSLTKAATKLGYDFPATDVVYPV